MSFSSPALNPRSYSIGLVACDYPRLEKAAKRIKLKGPIITSA